MIFVLGTNFAAILDAMVKSCKCCCRLAVLIFVAAPLAIWLWSLLAQKGAQDAVKRTMFGYWQVAEP